MVEDPAFEVESRLWDGSVPKLRDDWRGLAIGPANGWLALFGDMHQVGTKREAKRDMIRNSGSVLRHNQLPALRQPFSVPRHFATQVPGSNRSSRKASVV